MFQHDREEREGGRSAGFKWFAVVEETDPFRGIDYAGFSAVRDQTDRTQTKPVSGTGKTGCGTDKGPSDVGRELCDQSAIGPGVPQGSEHNRAGKKIYPGIGDGNRPAAAAVDLHPALARSEFFLPC